VATQHNRLSSYRNRSKKGKETDDRGLFLVFLGVLSVLAFQFPDGSEADSVKPVTFPRNATFYFTRSMIYDSLINYRRVSMRIVDIVGTAQSAWRRWSFVAGVMRREMIALVA